jgi:hypothetical protein
VNAGHIRDVRPVRDDLLVGRTATLTGDGAGTERRIALALVAVVAHVAIGSRQTEHRAPALETIRAAGTAVKAVDRDIRDRRPVEPIEDATEKPCGRNYVLVKGGGETGVDSMTNTLAVTWACYYIRVNCVVLHRRRDTGRGRRSVALQRSSDGGVTGRPL